MIKLIYLINIIIFIITDIFILSIFITFISFFNFISFFFKFIYIKFILSALTGPRQGIERGWRLAVPHRTMPIITDFGYSIISILKAKYAQAMK